ncbi:MAG: hypothetical protein AAFP08_01935 [Bacteroidota bacterium]
MRLGWRKVKAKAALQKGQVEIKFKKVSGEITSRVATAFQGEVSGSGKSSPLTLVFHSITDGGTRSCRIQNLLSITRSA